MTILWSAKKRISKNMKEADLTNAPYLKPQYLFMEEK
jgi:hypothetical protein